MLDLFALKQHCGKRITMRWRSPAAPLPASRRDGGGRGRGTVGEASFRAGAFRCPCRATGGSPRRVYRAKRASSVRSAFLLEPAGARAGGAPGGGGRGSGAVVRSSRNLSNSDERGKRFNKTTPTRTHTLECVEHMQLWSVHTFTGHPFLSSIPFLLRRGGKSHETM